ncbi:MAG: VWA domain-containing protein [Blastocatellia bacterium]
MPYLYEATRDTPALIIYLLDMSDSMNAQIGGQPKIDLVSKSMKKVAREMVQRCMKGTTVSPRYRVAIFAYNDEVRDLFGGAITIDQFVNTGIPVMKPSSRTDTAKAFLEAEALLQKEWASIQNGPAPLICHMTDGEYTDDDPLPIARRIMQMRTPDGNVLIENIFLDSDALPARVVDPYTWPGISSESQLASETARHLFQMSSNIPSSYRELFEDKGYSIAPNAKLLFPGDTPEMVEIGFSVSGLTGVQPPK